MFTHLKADLERYYGVDLRTAQPGRFARIRLLFDCAGVQACAIYRFGHWLSTVLGTWYGWPLRLLLELVYQPLAWFSRVMLGIRISRHAQIGPGLYIGHFGGIDIGPCVIGSGCSVHQRVKINAGETTGPLPVVGDRVWIGAHAVIAAGVQVASHATVAAGSVVAKDVPAGALVMGEPARVAAAHYDNRSLLGIAVQ